MIYDDVAAWVRVEGLDSVMIRARLEAENDIYNCIGTVSAKRGCWSFLKGGFVLNSPSNSYAIIFQVLCLKSSVFYFIH